MWYTIEIYKFDKRSKNGLRFINKYDFDRKDVESVVREVKELFPLYGDDYKFEIHETFVLRNNHLTGEPTYERYDTPFHCSVSSESYFCN